VRDAPHGDGMDGDREQPARPGPLRTVCMQRGPRGASCARRPRGTRRGSGPGGSQRPSRQRARSVARAARQGRLESRLDEDVMPDHPVFPHCRGPGLRDPSNAFDAFRAARGVGDLSWITTHVFRKTSATILDQAGLSARQVADQLGHERPSLTQDGGPMWVNGVLWEIKNGVVVCRNTDVKIQGGVWADS
jgi:integrase